MLIAVIILSLISAALAVYIIAYRRQVRRTCRQMAFMKENKTNMKLTYSFGLTELNELTQNINELLESINESQRNSTKNEKRLKEMITNLSHDIRTPLTSLDGYFQLLIKSKSNSEREYYLGIIQERITSLKAMLEELFTYTKLQDESFELFLEPMNFSKIVYDTVFSFYEEFKLRRHEPEADFCEERLKISGCKEALKRILQNIIKNALIHGGEKIKLQMTQDNGCAVFICSNNIIEGFEPDPDKVFLRFYKADTARTYIYRDLVCQLQRD